MITQDFTDTLVVESCCVCHVTFGLTNATYRARKADRGDFSCPNGHKQHYIGESETEQLRRRLRSAESSATSWRDQAEASERSARAYKGHVTRIRNMVANGICPVAGCRRNFTNVREHMATQHPDYHRHEDQP